VSRKLRLAINTGGGDAPGLNAVLRAVTLTALNKGFEVIGIQKGYLGLLDTKYLVPLTAESVRGITHLGGSILGTNNRGNPLAIRVVEGGQERFVDVSDQAVSNFRRLGLDGLIAVGGDGSLKIAGGLYKKGIPIIGVPKTIDNDLAATYETFGFETAVATATDAIDKLHSTAESHERVIVVELMGRYCGWIALYSGISGSADVILIPEIPFDIQKVCDKVMARELAGPALLDRGVRGGCDAARRHHVHPRSRGRGTGDPPRRHRGQGCGRDRDPHGQGDALARAGAPAARRHAQLQRPPALAALRRGRRPAGRGRALGHHGRLRSAGDDRGADRRGGGFGQARTSRLGRGATARDLGISFGD
jgi:hypothetical protein